MIPDGFEILEYALQTMMAFVCVICFGGGVMLLLRYRGNRARLLLGISMLICSVPYAARVCLFMIGAPRPEPDIIAEPEMCVLGMLFCVLLLAYPVELVRPGWLTLGRACLWALPAALSVLVFVIGIRLSGGAVQLRSLGQIGRDFGHFDVWFRFFITFMVFGYLWWTLRVVWGSTRRYREWCEANYADSDCVKGIGWLYAYCGGLLVLAVAYIVSFLYLSVVMQLVDAACVAVFMSVVLYKGLFYDNPYPEGFFRHGADADVAEPLPEQSGFAARIPEYTAAINDWLSKEKPFLNPHFKMTDTAKVVPLNRSYLSRVYNEGFGMSFSDLVRSLRMAEARRLLVEFPDESIAGISERCGFSSHSSFHRSFTASNGGLTPGEYRSMHLHERREI